VTGASTSAHARTAPTSAPNLRVLRDVAFYDLVSSAYEVS
jgi:hypothetical protein